MKSEDYKEGKVFSSFDGTGFGGKSRRLENLWSAHQHSFSGPEEVTKNAKQTYSAWKG